jgi:arylsulfatase
LSTRRPNILWILSDQHHARATGALSDGLVDTPALDALAERGTTFTNAFCQGPLCMPSRASLLYQRYVSDHGVVDNSIDGPPNPSPTAVQRVHDAGYHTVALGKMHFFRYPADVAETHDRMLGLGFDEAIEMHGKYGNADGRSAYTDFLSQEGELPEYRDFLAELNPMSRAAVPAGEGRTPHWSSEAAPLRDDDHPDAWLGRLAVDWLDHYEGKDPFFAIIGFSGPHDPWDAPDSYLDRYRDREMPLPEDRTLPTNEHPGFQGLVDYLTNYCDATTLTDDSLRALRRRYFAGVTLLDDQVGAILEALARRDDAAETFIIYTSDHGELLGEHGLLTKSQFYDAATRVPLILVPAVGGGPAVTDDLVELTDLIATMIDVTGAEPIDGAPGTSLMPLLRGESMTRREMVRSQSYGFGMWRSATHKIVVDEATLVPVQLFDLVADPGESTNLVSAPGSADVLTHLLSKVKEDLGRGESVL